jgi:predicted PurR-regulated permease PerM
MFHFIKDHDDKHHFSLDVPNRLLFRIVLVVVITLGIVESFLKVSHSVWLLFIAFFLALALNAPVTRIANYIPGKRKGSRVIATSIVYILVIVILGSLLAYMIPQLVSQTEKFISAAPSLVASAKDQHSALGHFIRRHHLQGFVTTLSRQISHRVGLSGLGSKAFSGLADIASSIFSVLAILALTFMMLIEGPRWLLVIKDLFVSPKKLAYVDRVTSDMYRVIKGYVNGQVLLAFIAAVLIAPALFILHISYPIALMVVIFLCGLIPMIGHTLGAIIVTIVALFHSVVAAVVVLVYYILYMQVENYLLQPRIQANTTDMSPLLVFASVIVGVNYAGLLGGLVAIPIAACIKVLVIAYLKEKRMLPKDLANESGD